MKADDDRDLVRACRDGEVRAFEALVERYQRPVFNAAFRLVNDFEDAKDITQRVFLKAYENLASYEPRFKFYSWIYRIAINESINFLDGRHRHEPIDRDWESGQRSPEEAFAGAELGRQVQEALMTLKPEYRTVIVLRHFLHCSYQEMSQVVGVAEKTVKSRLFTARQILKDALSERGARR